MLAQTKLAEKELKPDLLEEGPVPLMSQIPHLAESLPPWSSASGPPSSEMGPSHSEEGPHTSPWVQGEEAARGTRGRPVDRPTSWEKSTKLGQVA